MILVYRLQDSRLGRSWMAIREDELAAAASGINTVTTKLLAFALGASTAGVAGVFFASKLTLVSPALFGFSVSFTILAMVVLGGMGNVWGVALGAFILFEIQSVLLKQLNLFFDSVGTLPIIGDMLRQDRLHPVPVPALRHRARGDDAPATGGSLPEPPAAARAAHRGGRGVRRRTATRWGPHPNERTVRLGARSPEARARSVERCGPAAGTRRHQALRWPGRGRRRGPRDPARLDRQHHRTERRRQDDVLQRRRRASPTRRQGRWSSGATRSSRAPARTWLEPFIWVAPAARRPAGRVAHRWLLERSS